MAYVISCAGGARDEWAEEACEVCAEGDGGEGDGEREDGLADAVDGLRGATEKNAHRGGLAEVQRKL